MGFFKRLLGLEPPRVTVERAPEPVSPDAPARVTRRTLEEVFGIGSPDNAVTDAESTGPRKLEADNAESLRQVFKVSARPDSTPPRQPTSRRREFNMGDGVGFEMAIVGESYYGFEIRRLAGKRLERGEDVVFTVTLERDPDNEHDANAVKVVGPNGKQIGHLSREYAAEFQELLMLIDARGMVAACSAKMFGGRGRKANIGVWLDMEPVEVLLARLNAGEQPF